MPAAMTAIAGSICRMYTPDRPPIINDIRLVCASGTSVSTVSVMAPKKLEIAIPASTSVMRDAPVALAMK